MRGVTNPEDDAMRCICKNCGKEFVSGGRGRPKIFCSVSCREAWYEAWANSKKRIKAHRDEFYLESILNEEPDVERLSRIIVAQVLGPKYQDRLENFDD